MPPLGPDASQLRIGLRLNLAAMKTATHLATVSPQTGDLLLMRVELIVGGSLQRFPIRAAPRASQQVTSDVADYYEPFARVLSASRVLR